MSRLSKIMTEPSRSKLDRTPHKGVFTAVMKPTLDCNLGCLYCYVGDTDSQETRMNDTTLSHSITKVLDFGEDRAVEFIWHGGEPLLMGKGFYEKVVEIQKTVGKDRTIINSMQSNGTLLTEDFADFLDINNFQIGFSLDGPPELHNAMRPYKKDSGGGPSYDDVVYAMNLARKRKIGGIGAISVLNKASVGKVVDIYDFFKKSCLNLKFISLSCSGRAKDNYGDLSISPKEYATAMIALFDRWVFDKDHEDGIKLNVEPLGLIIRNMLAENPIGCNYSGSCRNNFVAIGPNGEIYSCGKFIGKDELCLGNINEIDVNQAFKSEVYREMQKRTIENMGDCSSCAYGKICNAGCMYDGYVLRENFMDKDYYCAGRKLLFSHMTQILRNEFSKEVMS